MLDHGVII